MAAQPVVSNVRAAQLAGTHKVESAYALHHGGGLVDPANVAVEISDDGGENWSVVVPGSAFSGAVGLNVSPGQDKEITFFPAQVPELAETFSKQVRFRVNATIGDGSGGGDGEMVTIEGGTLSSINALDGTQVATFQIGRHEVTWGEWKAVRAEVDARGYDIGNVGGGCADDDPVHSVSWYDVVKWCNLKSQIEGLTPVYRTVDGIFKKEDFGRTGSHNVSWDASADGYRLPSEAEWEYAARGGNQTNGYNYSGSNNVNEVGWYFHNSGGAACNLWEGHGTWPVGQKDANELRLYDMSGNVWEWCWDASNSSRRFRGGSWRDNAGMSSVSLIGWTGAGNRRNDFGFRLARNSGN